MIRLTVGGVPTTRAKAVVALFLSLLLLVFLVDKQQLVVVVGLSMSITPPHHSSSTITTRRIRTKATATETTTTSTTENTATNHRGNDADDGADDHDGKKSQEQLLLLQYYREQAHRISHTFVPEPFRPPASKSLLNNPHVQTMAGLFLRHEVNACYVPPSYLNNNNEEEEKDASSTTTTALLMKELSYLGKHSGSFWRAIQAHTETSDSLNFWDYRQRVDTPDGDFFHVDYKYHQHQIESYNNNDMGNNRVVMDEEHQEVIASSASPPPSSSRGLVVIVHGLQGSSNSSVCIDMARAYTNLNFDVACVHFRGCSGTPNNSVRAYHMGFTDDLKYFLEHVTRPLGIPIFLSGLSLGANVILKLLGELGTTAHAKYRIYGAAVTCVPLDNTRNVQFIQAPGWNRNVYNRKLLDSLRNSALSQLERHPHDPAHDLIDSRKLLQAELISEFDEQVIAKLWGYRNNTDYYQQTSCLNVLDQIAVPTFCLQSLDDPFFDPSMQIMPSINQSDPLLCYRTRHGGHAGYMFQQNKHDSPKPAASYMPWQLARFLQHAWDKQKALDRCSHYDFWRASGWE